MTAMFNAVDISGVATNVETLMIGFITIGLLFFGRKILRRLGVIV